MATRTRSSLEGERQEGETDWAEAAAAASTTESLYDEFLARDEEEDEDWVGPDDQFGHDDVDDDDGDDCDDCDGEDELSNHGGNGKQPHRSPWILQVGQESPASIYIDAGMTAERLGRCVSQAVSSYDGTRGRTFRDSTLVGLFGKDDGVFYSLECILAMKPADGERHIFCVTKPVKRVKPVIHDDDNSKEGTETSWVNHFTTGSPVLAATITILVLSMVIAIAPRIWNRLNDWRDAAFHRIHHWKLYVHSLLLLIPQDLPSMWRMVSFVLDWPAREIYRYGPSAVGWEGRDLVDICTQMNRRYYFAGLGHAGIGSEYEDREYWRQNSGACETIYRMKEESFVRMCRPLWYLMVMIATFVALHRLIAAAFARDPPPRLNRTDQAVLNTYHALQRLLREHSRQDGRRQQR